MTSNSTVPILEFIISLFVLGTKPRSASCKEYIKQLSICVEKGSHRDCALQLPHLANESAPLWYALYQDAQGTLAAREEVVETLGLRNAELERQHTQPEPESNAASHNLRKRKLEQLGTKQGSTSRPLKRITSAIQAKSQVAHDVCVEQLFHSEAKNNADKLGIALLHKLFMLHQILDKESPSLHNLAIALQDTASSILEILDDSTQCSVRQYASAVEIQQRSTTAVSEQAVSPNLESDEENNTRFDVITRIIPSLLAGLSKLRQLPNSKLFEQYAVHDIITVFRTILRAISKLSALECATSTVDGSGASQSQKKGSAKISATKDLRSTIPCSRCKRIGQHCDGARPTCGSCAQSNKKCGYGALKTGQVTKVPAPQSGIIRRLCELTKASAAYFYSPHLAHDELQDGCLFLLYTMVGESLKAASSESDYAPASPGPIIEGAFHQGNNIDRDQKKMQEFRARAPYLISLLEHVQNLVAVNHFQSNKESQCSGNQSAETAGARFRTSEATWTTEARNKLQHTLLKAVFGDERLADFRPSLEPPSTPPPMSDIPGLDLGEVEIEDWFKHEVLRIVGWDALKNHIRWGDEY